MLPRGTGTGVGRIMPRLIFMLEAAEKGRVEGEFADLMGLFV